MKEQDLQPQAFAGTGESVFQISLACRLPDQIGLASLVPIPSTPNSRVRGSQGGFNIPPPGQWSVLGTLVSLFIETVVEMKQTLGL